MKIQKKEDYKCHISITCENGKTDDVLCEIYLPERLTEPIDLIFRPTKEQFKQLENLFEFSIYGELKGFSGETETIIKAQTVYCSEHTNMHWGPDLTDPIIYAYPYDLKIIDILGGETKELSKQDKIKGTFWLTPSFFLNPFLMRRSSSTGEVKIEINKKIKFSLIDDLNLTFTKNFKYINKENGDTISFPELVAEFESLDTEIKIEQHLSQMDNFLMLSSLAERRRCVCLGWEMWDKKKQTKFFRRDIGIPESNESHDRLDALIDCSDFEEFIDKVYRKFSTLETDGKELIRKAIWSVWDVYEDKTIESKFISFYSSLESLVLFHNQNSGREKNLASGKWGRFRRDIKKFIGDHLAIEGSEKEKLGIIMEKVPELNRPSFSRSFNNFCSHYQIELDDLWPVVNKEEGASLSDLRHRLIHGGYFNPREYRALVAANENLRWIVERSILSVLEWPISKSLVSEGYLSKRMNIHKQWRSDRKLLEK